MPGQPIADHGGFAANFASRLLAQHFLGSFEPYLLNEALGMFLLSARHQPVQCFDLVRVVGCQPAIAAVVLVSLEAQQAEQPEAVLVAALQPVMLEYQPRRIRKRVASGLVQVHREAAIAVG